MTTIILYTLFFLGTLYALPFIAARIVAVGGTAWIVIDGIWNGDEA